MKLCKDCKNYEAHDLGSAHDKCKKVVVDESRKLVRGESFALYAYCESLRKAPELCGRDGNWFEPKD